MLDARSSEKIVRQAKELEREYNWLGAVAFYNQALSLVSEQDFLRKGEIYEQRGQAFHHAAMQAENREEFSRNIRLSIADYEKAKEFYGTLTESIGKPWMSRCDAMVAHLGYWLAFGATEKKSLIDKCWRLTSDSLKDFLEAKEALQYGKTYNQLSMSAILGYFLEWDYQAREKTIKEAGEYGEQAIALLSTLDDQLELAIASVRTASFLEWRGLYFLDLDESEKYYEEASRHWQKASALSEETAQTELLNCSAIAVQDSIGWATGSDTAITNFEEALKHARKTKDKFKIGCALDWLAYHIYWKATVTEDPDRSLEMLKKAMQYAEDAKSQFFPLSFISPRGGTLWIEVPHAECYWKLANRETDLSKRRELFEKAVEAVSDLQKRAEDSRCPDLIWMAHSVYARVLDGLAKTKTNAAEKKHLLEEALAHCDKAVKLAEQLEPLMYWNRGMMRTRLVDIKSELADLAKDPDTKKSMLEEAVKEKEYSLKLCARYAQFWEKKGSVLLFSNLGQAQYAYGDLLHHLYEFTNNCEQLVKALEAFGNAVESYQKLDLKSRMAECYWKAALTHDSLVDHLKAAESFDLASNAYKGAAEKIVQLKDFYQDHALYMRAWSEIEKARYHHSRQEYSKAKEHFEKAAELHQSSKAWNYLFPNYRAWAQIEQAEELSRKEQTTEALEAFKQATKSFQETKKSIQTKINEIESPDEKQMATNMLRITDLRFEYCLGRITLEEAKILDKGGEHYSSSEKYGSAAEIFSRIAHELDSEQDQKEIRLITNLSRAWQKMMQAEAEASPVLYREASQLFEEAKEFGPNEKTKMLALGHSRFCRALEAGTEFLDTWDVTIHAAALQYLESAANYYIKAGFQSASEYAEATGYLFDAYLHMDSAKKEIDLEKKAKLYIMAERVLQTSAGSFMKAEHPEKREQVLKLLERVRKERKLAISLTEVLHTPPIVSTTAFLTPQPTYEEAVGLEKFEHAEIRANVITSHEELTVGDDLDLEIELVNAGKSPALLTKIREVVPKGFELAKKPETYRLEDGCLNMKGKRLDPLKTEEIRLTLKSKIRGVFALKPTILYLDENGRNKSQEPKATTITVKELGIKGWLKGES